MKKKWLRGNTGPWEHRYAPLLSWSVCCIFRDYLHTASYSMDLHDGSRHHCWEICVAAAKPLYLVLLNLFPVMIWGYAARELARITFVSHKEVSGAENLLFTKPAFTHPVIHLGLPCRKDKSTQMVKTASLVDTVNIWLIHTCFIRTVIFSW